MKDARKSALVVTYLRIILEYWSINLYVIKSFLNKIALHRIIKVRHRHFLTRQNRLRLRYVVGTVALVSLTMTGFLGSMNSSIAYVPNAVDMIVSNSGDDKTDVYMASLSADALYQAEDDRSDTDKAAETLLPLVEQKPNNKQLNAQGMPMVMGPPPSDDLAASDKPVFGPLQPREEILKIRPGDTIAGALQKSGVTGAEAYRAVKSMSKYYNPRLVKPGQAISIQLEPSDNGMTLAAMNMKVDSIKELIVKKDEHERFQAELTEKAVLIKMKAAKATIDTSLYASAARAGIPASVIAEMIRLYSYEVDFQRDIRRGDTVEILYETYETEDGDFARYGNVMFANLKVDGTKIPIYRFEETGRSTYYREDGMNLKNTLMQTPIDGARMSSGYGMRRHPVLGYNKMHKGVDFAAPRGTPIYAAGDGVIEVAKRKGGYGKYIRIRHVNSLKTAYAHMNKFAKGMKAGKRVKQGDVIGYVGSTGRSTGPHLHFEVLKNNKQVNPKSIKTDNREKLAGKRLQKFKSQMAAIKQEYATLAQDLKFAQNDLSE